MSENEVSISVQICDYVFLIFEKCRRLLSFGTLGTKFPTLSEYETSFAVDYCDGEVSREFSLVKKLVHGVKNNATDVLNQVYETALSSVQDYAQTFNNTNRQKVYIHDSTRPNCSQNEIAQQLLDFFNYHSESLKSYIFAPEHTTSRSILNNTVNFAGHLLNSTFDKSETTGVNFVSDSKFSMFRENSNNNEEIVPEEMGLHNALWALSVVILSLGAAFTSLKLYNRCKKPPSALQGCKHQPILQQESAV